MPGDPITLAIHDNQIITADYDSLKDNIASAITHYNEGTKNGIFAQRGKKRAENLANNLSECSNKYDYLDCLQDTLFRRENTILGKGGHIGNLKETSLNTFLLRAIKNAFNLECTLKNEPKRKEFYRQLKPVLIAASVNAEEEVVDPANNFKLESERINSIINGIPCLEDRPPPATCFEHDFKNKRITFEIAKAILGIEGKLDETSLKTNFKRLSKTLHSDRNKSQQEQAQASETFGILREAKQIVFNVLEAQEVLHGPKLLSQAQALQGIVCAAKTDLNSTPPETIEQLMIVQDKFNNILNNIDKLYQQSEILKKYDYAKDDLFSWGLINHQQRCDFRKEYLYLPNNLRKFFKNHKRELERLKATWDTGIQVKNKLTGFDCDGLKTALLQCLGNEPNNARTETIRIFIKAYSIDENEKLSIILSVNDSTFTVIRRHYADQISRARVFLNQIQQVIPDNDDQIVTSIAQDCNEYIDTLQRHIRSINKIIPPNNVVPNVTDSIIARINAEIARLKNPSDIKTAVENLKTQIEQEPSLQDEDQNNLNAALLGFLNTLIVINSKDRGFASVTCVMALFMPHLQDLSSETKISFFTVCRLTISEMIDQCPISNEIDTTLNENYQTNQTLIDATNKLKKQFSIVTENSNLNNFLTELTENIESLGELYNILKQTCDDTLSPSAKKPLIDQYEDKSVFQNFLMVACVVGLAILATFACMVAVAMISAAIAAAATGTSVAMLHVVLTSLTTGSFAAMPITSTSAGAIGAVAGGVTGAGLGIFGVVKTVKSVREGRSSLFCKKTATETATTEFANAAKDYIAELN